MPMAEPLSSQPRTTTRSVKLSSKIHGLTVHRTHFNKMIPGTNTADINRLVEKQLVVNSLLEQLHIQDLVPTREEETPGR